MNTQINIYIVLGILFFHWVFDFILQTDEQAQNKSKDLYALLSHTVSYSSAWFIISILYAIFTSNMAILAFAPITFLIHTATDFYTSRVNSQLYEQNKTHEFFVSIGFDQWLHFVQLLLTYQLLTK